ncbi:Peptidyl-prolyl cis-trans isomerase-like protein 4 [Hordeum vulgare]|nr:Peptidyl-prolyl cis-trans isomerase-like protein 4 [Hordeum vulgare]
MMNMCDLTPEPDELDNDNIVNLDLDDKTPSPPANRFLLPHTTRRRRRLEAVRKGNAPVGVRGTDTVVLGVERNSTPKLQDSRSVWKIASLDTHVALACAGFKADARVLINLARVECQSHRLTIEDPVTVDYITRYIAGLQQKMKYYNGCLFHKVEKDFLAQSGDPTGTGSGGDSVYKFLYGDQARFFNDEIRPELRHSKTGTIAMASAGENCNASQFYITLRDDVDYLDDKHTVLGTVAEGLDTLTKIMKLMIKYTYILDDPFDYPPQLAELIPENSPLGKPRDEVAEERLEDSWVPLDETVDPGQLEELIRSKKHMLMQ